MLVGESDYWIDSGYNSQGPMDNGETPKATISTLAESLLAGLVKCARDGPYRSCSHSRDGCRSRIELLSSTNITFIMVEGKEGLHADRI